jgi:hypothetical protein
VPRVASIKIRVKYNIYNETVWLERLKIKRLVERN